MNKLTTILTHEFLLFSRRWYIICVQFFFFILTLLIFILNVNSNIFIPKEIFISALWSTILLSNIVIQPHLFNEDIEDGSLKLYIIYAQSIWPYLLAKTLICWILTSVPAIIIFAVHSELLYNTSYFNGKILVIILTGTFLCTAINILIASLSAGLKRNTALSMLLIFPLYIPILTIAPTLMLSSIEQPQQPLYLLFTLLFIMVPSSLLGTLQAIHTVIQR